MRMNLLSLLAITLLASGVQPAFGAVIALQNATATFSQTDFTVDETIDGSFSSGLNGWAISPSITAQTAVWETVTDLDAGTITFRIHSLHVSHYHLLGRFRLSATADDRSTFADGSSTGGDVTAAWTVLSSPSFTPPAGMTANILGDGSILMSGTTPANGVYNLTYSNSLENITGFRLEALEDASLPFNGPGLYSANGNFVVTEFEVDASGSAAIVPEPSILAMLAGLGGIGLLGWTRRRRRSC